MSAIGQPEHVTQNRVIALFRDELRTGDTEVAFARCIGIDYLQAVREHRRRNPPVGFGIERVFEGLIMDVLLPGRLPEFQKSTAFAAND